jgi:hypothetical protein
VAYSFFLYRKKQDGFEKKGIFWTTAILRALSVATLAFLLLSPIFRNLQNKEEKPTIAFLIDNSASQKQAFPAGAAQRYQEEMNNLMTQLSEDFTVRPYHFGEYLSDTVDYSFQQNMTDISGNLDNLIESFDSENLGAIVLASDGIYNVGSDPSLKSSDFPGSIYTVGVGDTTIQKDAAVSRVFANKTVYLNDKFSIRSDLSVYAGKGKNLQISIYSHTAGRVVASKNITANSGRFATSIETVISASRAGLQRYSVRISKLDGERNIANNVQDVFVEVLDNKEKILILANAPHPDIAAIKQSLSINKNYKITVATVNNLTVRPADYNLIFLHNLPSARFNANTLISQAKKAGVSICYIVGHQTALPLLNKTQNALQISPRGQSQSNALAKRNLDFSYFNLSIPKEINFPPLSTPFGGFKAGPNTQTLFRQAIGSVNTDYPLWIMQTGARAKTAVIAGEGLWRWKMYDYKQHKNFKIVEELITKTAQFLSVKNDKRKFRLTTSKGLYNETDAINFDAELYNEGYELVNTPDVQLEIKNTDAKVMSYTMNKEGNSYAINVGSLSKGSYSYKAYTQFNGKTYSEYGKLKVVEQNIEDVNTTADFAMLKQLADNHNGEFVSSNNIASLYDKIKKNKNIKTILRSELTTFPLIDKKWLFFILFLLLALEWFLRKRFGTY